MVALRQKTIHPLCRCYLFSFLIDQALSSILKVSNNPGKYVLFILSNLLQSVSQLRSQSQAGHVPLLDHFVRVKNNHRRQQHSKAEQLWVVIFRLVGIKRSQAFKVEQQQVYVSFLDVDRPTPDPHALRATLSRSTDLEARFHFLFCKLLHQQVQQKAFTSSLLAIHRKNGKWHVC